MSILNIIKRYLKMWCHFSTLIILLSINLAISCNNNNCDYKLFAFKEDDIRIRVIGGVILEHPLFTFEYPRCFELIDLNRMPDIAHYRSYVTDVTFLRRVEDKLFFEEFISVVVHRPGVWGDTDAKTYINNVINMYSSPPDYENFQLIQKTSINIDGLPAEYISFSYHTPTSEGTSYPPYDRVVRLVSFDYDGFLWKLRFDCYTESAEETELYFNHLIETFEFIEKEP